MDSASGSSAVKRAVDEFKPVSILPSKYGAIFSEYMYFNRIQSDFFSEVINSDNSVVIAAPTGSGKTVVFELAIVKFLMNLDERADRVDQKIIYVAPMKALCEERLTDWHQRFMSLNLSFIMATGDSEDLQLRDLINYNVIITTPEKWDSLTRQWRNQQKFVESISLFMIDEVHLLNDESRGSTLEAIVSRMKTIQPSNPKSALRFIAASATVPNVDDIAEWLGADGKPCIPFKFGEELRPVNLQKIVIGYSSQTGKPDFKFDINLNYKLHQLIVQYSSGKPTLIFCSTRKSVEMAAKQISLTLTMRLTIEQRELLHSSANRLNCVKTSEILKHGIGMHHAGIMPSDRNIMENLFRSAQLPVLVTTSTLAMGVNLPAHLVIVKNTRYYCNGEYRDYTESSLLQMIGRAGRPQFDTEAIAVIMTTHADKLKYERLANCTEPVESNLHRQLPEHLNSEIVLRTLTDIDVAMKWLTTTFLYIRARKNPRHYSLPVGLNTQQMNNKLLEMCQIEINKLARYGMIVIGENVAVTPTHVGIIMAKYCVNFETVKNFTQVQGNEVLQQMLTLISKSKEFDGIFLRTNEKRFLNMFNTPKNKECIRFPLTGKISTAEMKINCLIQATLGCLGITDPSLQNEGDKIIKIGEKLTKCLCEYLATGRKNFRAQLSAITLMKCFKAKLWENSMYVARQLPGIGSGRARMLVNEGKTSIRSLLEANPRNLDLILHRRIGDQIIETARHLPQYSIEVRELKVNVLLSKIKIIIYLHNSQDLDDSLSISPQSCMTLIVGNETSNEILFNKNVTQNFMIEHPVWETVLKSVFDFKHEVTISAHFISENWVGFDCSQKFTLFSQPKELRAASPANVKMKSLESTKKSCQKRKPPMNQRPIDTYFKHIKRNSPNVHPRQGSAETATSSQSNITEVTDYQVGPESVPILSRSNCLINKTNTSHNNYQAPLASVASVENTISVCPNTAGGINESVLLLSDNELTEGDLNALNFIEASLLQSSDETETLNVCEPKSFQSQPKFQRYRKRPNVILGNIVNFDDLFKPIRSKPIPIKKDTRKLDAQIRHSNSYKMDAHPKSSCSGNSNANSTDTHPNAVGGGTNPSPSGYRSGIPDLFNKPIVQSSTLIQAENKCMHNYRHYGKCENQLQIISHDNKLQSKPVLRQDTALIDFAVQNPIVHALVQSASCIGNLMGAPVMADRRACIDYLARPDEIQAASAFVPVPQKVPAAAVAVSSAERSATGNAGVNLENEAGAGAMSKIAKAAKISADAAFTKYLAAYQQRNSYMDVAPVQGEIGAVKKMPQGNDNETFRTKFERCAPEAFVQYAMAKAQLKKKQELQQRTEPEAVPSTSKGSVGGRDSDNQDPRMLFKKFTQFSHHHQANVPASAIENPLDLQLDDADLDLTEHVRIFNLEMDDVRSDLAPIGSERNNGNQASGSSRYDNSDEGLLDYAGNFRGYQPTQRFQPVSAVSPNHFEHAVDDDALNDPRSFFHTKNYTNIFDETARENNLPIYPETELDYDCFDMDMDNTNRRPPTGHPQDTYMRYCKSASSGNETNEVAPVSIPMPINDPLDALHQKLAMHVQQTQGHQLPDYIDPNRNYRREFLKKLDTVPACNRFPASRPPTDAYAKRLYDHEVRSPLGQFKLEKKQQMQRHLFAPHELRLVHGPEEGNQYTFSVPQIEPRTAPPGPPLPHPPPPTGAQSFRFSHFESYDNAQPSPEVGRTKKNLIWRSPLVMSQRERFSPHLSNYAQASTSNSSGAGNADFATDLDEVNATLQNSQLFEDYDEGEESPTSQEVAMFNEAYLNKKGNRQP